MPKTSLGIQLTAGEAVAVCLKSSWRGTVVERVVRLERRPPGEEAPSPAEVLPAAEAVVAALATDQVFPRIVELPFTDRRRIEQAAPLEAEESLPLPLENLVCDVQVLRKEKKRSRALLAAAPVEQVSALLGELRLLGAVPQVVDVEALALGTVARRCLDPAQTALLLDVSPVLCQAVVVRGGTPLAFHAFSTPGRDPGLADEVALYLASSGDEEPGPDAVYVSGPEALVLDLDHWRSVLGLPVDQLPFPRRGIQVGPGVSISWPVWAVPLGLALRGLAPKTGSQINLLRGPFGPRGEEASGRQLAVVGGVYAAVLLALWGAAAWTEASFKQKQYDALQKAVRSTFQQVLPDVRNVVSEVDQLRAKVQELEERDRNIAGVVSQKVSPLGVLRDLSAKIPRDLEVEFRDVSVDQNRVVIEGTTNSYRASERIKAEISAAFPRHAAVTSEAKDGVKPGEILFKLNIDLGEKR